MSLLLSRRSLLTGLGAGLGASLMNIDLARALLPQQRAYLTSQAVDYIDVVAGQSNEIYGDPFNASIDIGDARFFQMFSGTEGVANKVSVGGANDPLDNPDPTGITTPAIGNAVHFHRDYFLPNVNPRRVLFLPCAYGGTKLTVTSPGQWGVTSAVGGSSIGSLTVSAIARVALARQLWPAAKLIWRMELIEGDFDGYGTSGPIVRYILSLYRGAYLDWMLYIRSQLATIGYPSFPILIGRPNNYALTTNISAGADNWYYPDMVAADAIVRALATRMPNVGVADSVNPTAATWQSGSLIHFDAAGQRTMAGRYWNAYQQAIGNANFPTSPVWEPLDYLSTTLGYPSGFTVASGGATIAGDSTSAWKTALATSPSQPSSSAMLYAEIKANTISSSGNVMVGLCNQAIDLLWYLGGSTPNPAMADYGSASYFSGSTSLCNAGSANTWAQTSFACPAIATGDVIMLAVNRATGKAWIGRNGAWLNTGNPSSGANPWLTGIPRTDQVYLACSIYTDGGNVLSINGRSSQFAFSPPSGFQPWGH